MLIAFAGLPSSGKSSTAKALARLMEVEVHLEPEESAWPDLVREREISGTFTALSWFRTVRVPQLFKADAARKNNQTAIIDSYYDVLIARYLGDDAFEWLVSRQDPYFPAAKAMVDADWETLPKADVIVFLNLDEATWIEFMSRRDRDFDRNAELNKHFEMQEKMLQACKAAEQAHGSSLIVVNQASSTPEETARRVATAIGITL